MQQPDTERLQFTSKQGHTLDARLDKPVSGDIKSVALFAHCFTCSKDYPAARRIAAKLAANGYAVLRFDFTGLGHSEGEFANSGFTANIEDLVAAADYLRETLMPPALLIGHSLGGAAVIAAAEHIPEVKAVATIGAPFEVDHVLKQLGDKLEKAKNADTVEVNIAGRKFVVGRAFVEQSHGQPQKERLGRLDRALLVMHAPGDTVVGIDNASQIFAAAKHPKSYVSLNQADHLLRKKGAAAYAANIIATWAEAYVLIAPPSKQALAPGVIGRFVQSSGILQRPNLVR